MKYVYNFAEINNEEIGLRAKAKAEDCCPAADPRNAFLPSDDNDVQCIVANLD